MSEKRSITFRGTEYNVAEFGELEFYTISQFYLAFSPDHPGIERTESLDQAAAYNFRLIVPGLPKRVFTPEGVRGLTMRELVELYSAIAEFYSPESEKAIDAPQPEQGESEVDRLRAQVEALEERLSAKRAAREALDAL